MEPLSLNASIVLSIYLQALVVSSILYPFVIAGISLTFENKVKQRPYIVRTSIIWLAVTLILIALHAHNTLS
ncbi:hypothetical protein KP803_15575 [Vibrio sp. ZSDE26]|uniref:Uncharacterized protein n=1 Tax=Vibrio amylolyticus TaxID=2847292 RepID=A0A9X1XSH0_9VIBR|nr:hypothetical protein [Vibrio amylolyticus]MCK6264699.1 hypothetical protein [Vibrio amylolyticus]